MERVAGGTGRHYSGTYTRVVVEHVRAVAGDDGVADLLARCGQADRLGDLLDDAMWSSYDQFRGLLEAAVDVLGSYDAFEEFAVTGALVAGSMPGTTEALLAMGSPGALLAELNDNTAGTTTIEESFTEQEGPSTWRLGHRMLGGYEAFEALCAFHTASCTMLPRLFGYASVRAEEVTCVRHGDPWCSIRLSWEEDGGDAQRAEFLANRLALVERRLEVFEETVAQVVATEDLESALRRVVAAAAGSVRAPCFILALEPLPWAAKLVYGYGLTDADAERVADAGVTDADLAVNIESGRGRHGQIIAVGARGLIPPSMEDLLRGYAQLAATALERAIAVEEARRQTATAKVLLDLAMRLARTGSIDELAQTLVEVVPGLVGCDRAIVATVEGLEATPIAVQGYTPEFEAKVMAGPIELRWPLSPEIVYAAEADVVGQPLALMRATESKATVMVPMLVDGEVVAWISGDVTHDAFRLAPSAELEERLRGLAALASTAMHNTLLLERVSHQADHDPLTGLPNRKGLIDRLVAGPVPTTAVLFVDLDDFKDVNDGLGHLMGDLLLCQVAERLRAAVRDDDLVARLGGDEFAVLVADPKPGSAQRLGRRVVEAFQQPFDLRGRRVTISASVGLTTQTGTPEELLRSADVAMYRAKAAGKGRLALFEPSMDHAASERLTLHADLAEAVDDGQLRLLFQPVFDLADGTLRCGEALVRWDHPTLGMLGPDRFIDLAEETGLIVPIGSWVLRHACEQARVWPEDVAIAVNLSPRQLDSPGIVADVAEALARSGVRPDRLVLEITENVLARDVDVMIPRIEELRALGVRIAIDDFGTGYSSLSALVRLPVDILKIDRGLISQMLVRPAAVGLVQILIDLGRTLGLDVVAEGIEELEQATALRERHCDLGQGFLFSRPVPADAFVAFFASPVPA